MNFLLTNPLQGSTCVDHACSLGNGDSPLLLVSCHDAVHGYALHDDDGGGTSGLHRAWSCSMLDRMEGLLQLPPPRTPPPTGTKAAEPCSSSTSSIGGPPRILMLTSDADLELYSVQTDRPAADEASTTGLPSPRMRLLSSCALAPPAAATTISALDTAATSSHASSASLTPPPLTASRRPEGPTWSGAIRVQEGPCGLEANPDAEDDVAVSVVSVYHDFLHLVRVKGCSAAGSGQQGGPQLSTVAMHLGSSALTGVTRV